MGWYAPKNRLTINPSKGGKIVFENIKGFQFEPNTAKFGCGTILMILFFLLLYAIYNGIEKDNQELTEKGLVEKSYKQSMDLKNSIWSFPLDDSLKYIFSTYKVTQLHFKFIVSLRNTTLPDFGNFRIYLKKNNDYVIKYVKHSSYTDKKYDKYFIEDIYIVDSCVSYWKVPVPDEEKENPMGYFNQSTQSIDGKFELAEQNEKGESTGRLIDQFNLPDEFSDFTSIELTVVYLMGINNSVSEVFPKKSSSSDVLLPSLDRQFLYPALFNTDEKNKWCIWKPTPAEKDSSNVSTDGFCHTRVETILYYTDWEVSKAAVVFGTYEFDENGMIFSHGSAPMVCFAVAMKKDDRNWQVLRFIKNFGEHGSWGQQPAYRVANFGRNYFLVENWGFTNQG